MLIPARTDTARFHDYILGKAEVRLFRSRLTFGEAKNPAPFPSMVVIFGKGNCVRRKNLAPYEKVSRQREEKDMVDIIKKLGSELAPEGVAMASKAAIKTVVDTAVKHGPECLVVTAIAGFGTTVYLAVKEVPKAKAELAKRPIATDAEGKPAETRVQRFVKDAKVVVPICAPAIVMGGVTVASIIGGNRLQAKEIKDAAEKIAALSAAYTLAEKASTAYQEEVIEKLGEEAHKEIASKVGERVASNAPYDCPTDGSGAIVNIEGGGNVLFYDEQTGKCFWSSRDKVDAAFGRITRKATRDGRADICDLYEELTGRAVYWDLGSRFGWDPEHLPAWRVDDATLDPDGKTPKAVLSYSWSLIDLEKSEWRI